jgi:hypothetical protein
MNLPFWGTRWNERAHTEWCVLWTVDDLFIACIDILYACLHFAALITAASSSDVLCNMSFVGRDYVERNSCHVSRLSCDKWSFQYLLMTQYVFDYAAWMCLCTVPSFSGTDECDPLSLAAAGCARFSGSFRLYGCPSVHFCTCSMYVSCASWVVFMH